MKVTYLGNKMDMVAQGYDFSEERTHDIKGDTKEEVFAIKKFMGNRYFHVDHPDNYEAPKFYVYPIVNIVVGKLEGARTIRRRENVKVYGAKTEEDAKNWIRVNGGSLNKTHYIKKSDEGIEDCSHLYSKEPVEDPEVDEPDGPISQGAVFKKKTDGNPYAKPSKTFEGEDSKEQAEQWLKDEGVDPKEYLIMVK